MRFSQRYGYSPVRDAVQLEDMDDALRISLWNALEMYYWPPLDNYSDYLPYPENRDLHTFCAKLWINFFKHPFDTLANRWTLVKQYIRTFFFECPWYEVYDFVEFVAKEYTIPYGSPTFEIAVNSSLEQEMSGYRLVDGNITPITSPVEINAIEDAIAGPNKAVSDQLGRALELLSDRDNPDYRNSVKESISAVEGQARYALGTDRGTLGDLVRQLEQKTDLHPALKDGFSKLYGYTSDESGIRHALMDNGREVSFEEAKFMLVACCAFVNYIRGINQS